MKNGWIKQKKISDRKSQIKNIDLGINFTPNKITRSLTIIFIDTK